MVVSLAAAILVVVIAVTATVRPMSRAQCERKSELSAGRFVWADYSFFSYECLLRTPGGNVTETPVLPIEDVTP